MLVSYSAKKINAKIIKFCLKKLYFQTKSIGIALILVGVTFTNGGLLHEHTIFDHNNFIDDPFGHSNFFVGKHTLPPNTVKITKTVAVKIPVPHPVPVPFNIPYPVPVHITRTIPVEVPKIIPVQELIPIPVGGHSLAGQHIGSVTGLGQTTGYAGGYSSNGYEKSGYGGSSTGFGQTGYGVSNAAGNQGDYINAYDNYKPIIGYGNYAVTDGGYNNNERYSNQDYANAGQQQQYQGHY